MPKCSCAGSSCSCTIQVGDGLTLTGTGNAGSPFTVSLAQNVVTIAQSAAGVVDLSAVKSGAVVILNLSAAVTGFTLPVLTGARVDLIIKQVTAGNTVAWGTGIKWPGGAAPAVSATAGWEDWFGLRALSASEWIGTTMGMGIR